MRASVWNTARINLMFFLESVQQRGMPSRIRINDGAEYVRIREFMTAEMGANRGSAIVGRSVHNQRIERMWRDVFLKVLAIYYRLFYLMEDNQILCTTNEAHVCIAFRVRASYTNGLDAMG